MKSKATFLAMLAFFASCLSANAQSKITSRTAVLSQCDADHLCIDLLVAQDSPGGTKLHYTVYSEYSWVIVAHEPWADIPDSAFVVSKDATGASLIYNGSNVQWLNSNGDYLSDDRSFTQSVSGVVTKWSEKGIERPQDVSGSVVGYVIKADPDRSARVELRTRQQTR